MSGGERGRAIAVASPAAATWLPLAAEMVWVSLSRDAVLDLDGNNDRCLRGAPSLEGEMRPVFLRLIAPAVLLRLEMW